MGKSIQSRILDKIRESFNDQNSFIEELEKLLLVSKSSIYKRLQGTVNMDISELEILSLKFGINLNDLFNIKSDSIQFSFPSIQSKIKSTQDFLKPIYEDLKVLADSKTAKVNYVSIDLPIFYNFIFPELAYFKFYVYHNAIWKDKTSFVEKINFDKIRHDKEVFAMFNEMRELYAGIESEEVWTGTVFNATIKQIFYFLESDLFDNPKDALKLMDKLSKIIDIIAAMISEGNKNAMQIRPTESGKFTLYHNDIHHVLNTIVINSEDLNSIYITYDSPNYFNSSNKPFIDYTNKWIRKIYKKSTPITMSSDKEQIKFIKNLRKHLKIEREKVEKLVDEY